MILPIGWSDVQVNHFLLLTWVWYSHIFSSVEWTVDHILPTNCISTDLEFEVSSLFVYVIERRIITLWSISGQNTNLLFSKVTGYKFSYYQLTIWWYNSTIINIITEVGSWVSSGFHVLLFSIHFKVYWRYILYLKDERQ